MAKKSGHSKRPGRGSDQFIVRLPDGMRDRIATIADETGRSMNTIIVEALTLHLDHAANDLNETVGELWARLEKLETTVRNHDEQINRHRYSDDD